MIKVKELSTKHCKTLDEILTKPPKSGIKWDDVVSLIKKLGGKVKNGSGSRRKFILMGSVYQTHQPHPGNVMDKGAVNGLREWFENVIGVDYD
ncbi:type II toxin-antitoxin system HicA family toxin [Xenorhabdus bovienii]|uniref:type II toxin-antitoxin system HicA family toxin n=1 Tax=Xenorhabdus bovienii TaxID=40576 RepID=UPI00237CD550|nr:type II toxin-antitoxin system HicA family toxin [Xenorhabdus bovienii]MDE1476283.1 type II toxin-antitoxin system HicA family toxin [Xenorhabdus bovienii]MDE1486437.1 type II toxin-antitoxin system HicA family toxin [Xenorhabdus bovienii]MDE1497389.1 type II toxin-antitoxin system HicA family toxin [Xenorhabdus bovienii]MDE9437102.1 type II toxin-antitoxin system HicA family toxin [Xenorhabdus bovienii]MDE9477246.1 type II toxin-antitoxin system HicA family toxin [Xenorhabdus bovienii]